MSSRRGRTAAWCARRVIGRRRGVLKGAAVLQIGRDARGAELVVANGRRDAGYCRTPAHHRVGVRLRQVRGTQLPGAARDRAKEWPLRLVREAGAVEIRMQVRLERVVTRHRVRFAAFSAQTPS